MLCLCHTGAVAYAWPGPFWTLSTSTLGHSVAAAAVGLINSIGNLGGFVGPTVVGGIVSAGYPVSSALTFVAAAFVTAGCLVLAASRHHENRKAEG